MKAMTEYIKKAQAKELIRNHILGCAMLPSPEYTLDDLFHDMCWDLNHIPPADVAPVVHGKWVRFNDFVYVCSHCSGVMPAGFCMFQFCPHCGAQMDGGENND